MRRLVAAVMVLGASACASRTSGPPLGPHGTSDIAKAVPAPPDVVRVQDVPLRPNLRAVWIDGSWNWEVRGWVWHEGSWQEPPAGAWYARPSLARVPVRADDGSSGSQSAGMELMFVPGHWHLPDGCIWEAARAGKTGASGPGSSDKNCSTDAEGSRR